MQRDKYGLIVQTNGDHGDTAQREGFVWFGLWIWEHLLKKPWPEKPPLTFEQTINLLEINRSGIFRRHPDPTSHWSHPDEFSRDQQTPLVAAMGVWGLKEPLKRLWKKTQERGMKCQNGEPAPPSHQNLFCRMLDCDLSAFGEFQLFTMLGSIILRGNSNPDDVGDDLNFIVDLMAAHLRRPTECAKYTICQYSTSRPVSYGCYMTYYRHCFPGDFTASKDTMISRITDGVTHAGWKPDCPRALGPLRWYFRAEEHGNPDIADLYEPIVDKFFLGKQEYCQKPNKCVQVGHA